MSGWANVYRPLKDRFPADRYHFGKSFVSFQENKNKKEISAHFDDGTAVRRSILRAPRCPACWLARPPRYAWNASFPSPMVKA